MKLYYHPRSRAAICLYLGDEFPEANLADEIGGDFYSIDLGCLDDVDPNVISGPGPEIYIPMRVISNGTGSERFFTLSRLSDMSDEKFAQDVEWVKRDLNALKNLLEA